VCVCYTYIGQLNNFGLWCASRSAEQAGSPATKQAPSFRTLTLAENNHPFFQQKITEKNSVKILKNTELAQARAKVTLRRPRPRLHYLKRLVKSVIDDDQIFHTIHQESCATGLHLRQTDISTVLYFEFWKSVFWKWNAHLPVCCTKGCTASFWSFPGHKKLISLVVTKTVQ